MHLLARPPCPALAPLVTAYWFIEDRAGLHVGQPIVTAPRAGAVLTVNFGRPCSGEFATGAPRASLLGVQTRARHWRSSADCDFVMVLLTIAGLVRLFPNHGASGDEQLELGAVLGDRATHDLCTEIEAATPAHIAARLDTWLLARLDRPPVAEYTRLLAAHAAARRDARVDRAAAAVDISPRQLERWYAAHVGHGPRRLLGLDRLQASLRAAQTAGRDPLAGYSDQPHQIRTWRRHLGLTPGAYPRPSSLAAHFLRERHVPDDLAHFL